MRMRQRFASGLLAIWMAISPSYAEDLPELGDVASTELSVASEKKIGLQIINEIRAREPSYLDDPDVEAYLNQLGGDLAAASSEPGFGFFFFAINDPSINAFAMPGGYIGVHSGLILAAQSESELAGVLAHEISHVTQRHIARQIYQSRNFALASMVAMGLAILAARSNAQVASATIATTQAGLISSQLAYSRDFEREADRLGFDTLRRAGYDVHGMSGFFTRLQKAVRLYENNATAYLRTHPLTGERMSDMQNREQGAGYRQVADSVDFQWVRAKLRAMQGRPPEAIRDFQEMLHDRKFISEPATRYGLAYAYFRNRDWASAETELERVRAGKPSVPMLERLRAEVRIARGDAVAGLQVFRDAILRYPLNQSLIHAYGPALAAARRYDEALRFAEGQLRNYPEDLRLHRLRVESYAGLGRRSQQHGALAEVFALQGQTQQAVEQLQLAQQAADANFYEMSVIDSRLRELKQRLREEMKEKRN